MPAPPGTGTRTAIDRPKYTAGSRQVDFFATYEFANQIAGQHGYNLTVDPLPIAGSLAWRGMPDDDARKLLSLLLRGVHATLADECRQEQLTAAAKAVSTAADWAAVAQAHRRHQDAIRSGAHILRRRP